MKVQALSGSYGLGPGRTVNFGLITDTWDGSKDPTDPANNSPGAWNQSGFDGNGPNLVGADGNPANLLSYTSTTDGGEFDVDVTSLLQAWAANPTAYHGIGVFSPDTAATHGGIYGAGSSDFPGVTGQLILDQASLGPPTWNAATGGNWNTGGNWSGGIPAPGGEANFFGAITANSTVFTDSDVTVSKLHFDSPHTYNIAGTGTMTIQNSSGNGLIEVLNGTQKINLPLVIASTTDLSVANGATLKISDPLTVNGGVSLNPSPTGTVTYESTVTLLPAASIAFTSSQHLAGLTVGANATATVQQNGSRVLEADSVSISSTGGKVDLKNNQMIFRGQGAGNWNGSAYDGVTGLVASGKLTTSMPDAAQSLTGLAVKTAGSDTKVVYTYVGDANADGVINGDDYASIDAGFSANLKNYANGDFDYNGKINADDYFLIDRNYSAQGAPFAPASLPGGVSAVPEPASLGIVAMSLGAMFARRRRRI
jgi:hypothetical protein